eukprot:3347379-Rhodomonas_salina.3
MSKTRIASSDSEDVVAGDRCTFLLGRKDRNGQPLPGEPVRRHRTAAARPARLRAARPRSNSLPRSRGPGVRARAPRVSRRRRGQPRACRARCAPCTRRNTCCSRRVRCRARARPARTASRSLPSQSSLSCTLPLRPPSRSR